MTWQVERIVHPGDDEDESVSWHVIASGFETLEEAEAAAFEARMMSASHVRVAESKTRSK